MRVFASDAIKKMMGRFGIPEDEPIENKLITKSLESAQTKIEGFHFDARKHVLEYDDVLNHQRTVIYRRRRKLLLGDKKDIETEVNETTLGDEALAKAVEERKKTIGEDNYFEAARRLLLQTIDLFWVDHLEAMDYLRGSVNLRAYGQRDPLVEYKKEGLRLFKQMEAAIDDEVIKLLPHLGNVTSGGEIKLEESQEGRQPIFQKPKPSSLIPDSPSVGRNDPCPCGSGKKYKKCGMLNTEEHKRLMANK